MKHFTLILFVLFFSNCVSYISATKSENIPITSAQSSPTPPNSNQVVVGDLTQISNEDSATTDDDRRKKREQEMQNVPEVLKKIDFQNFTYPSKNFKKGIPLEDGEYEFDFDFKDDLKDDRGFVSFDNIFYVDLGNDGKKEAMVLLKEYHCGAGCAASESLVFYVFSENKNKPEIIWTYSSGSRGYDGGLKSFTIKNKEIVIEEFQKCHSESLPIGNICNSNWIAKNFERKIYAIEGNKISKKSSQVFKTEIIDVKGYKAEINIPN